MALDEGMSLFASAAHATDPPSGLQRRVLTVLQDEWADSPAPLRSPARMLALAAVLVLLVGALAWAGMAQLTANRRSDDIAQARARAARFEHDAASYQRFLTALGGRDVRVAVLRPGPGSTMEGSAILYDSTRGQSWVLVLLQAPGASGTFNIKLVRPNGRTIELHPTELAEDGDGASWLVTSADISRISTVHVTDESGRLVASGTASSTDEA
jgi:hypothetical protein